MIPVRPAPPPGDFAARVLTPGRRWLRANPKKAGRPPAYWLRVRAELARAFEHRCGYSAMYEPVGTVDHYLSIEGGHRSLAYAWSNLRYSAGWVNSSKATLDDKVLDPFLVRQGWFELLLPSLQLVMTNKVPVALRKKAQLTLDRLGLGHGEQVIRQRQAWYTKYQEGKAPLELLDDWAPLLAAAIRKQEGTEPALAPKRRTKPVRNPARSGIGRRVTRSAARGGQSPPAG